MVDPGQYAPNVAVSYELELLLEIEVIYQSLLAQFEFFKVVTQTAQSSDRDSSAAVVFELSPDILILAFLLERPSCEMLRWSAPLPARWRLTSILPLNIRSYSANLDLVSLLVALVE